MSLIVPAIPVQAPRPFNFRKFFLIIIVAFIAASFGAVMMKAFSAKPEVTVRPCATCPTCACKPLLGGPRCGCPR